MPMPLTETFFALCTLTARQRCKLPDEITRRTEFLGGCMFSNLMQDVRYATRTFAKQPSFVAVAVLTLALGIGANSAIFSVIYGVLLKPLALKEPERVIKLWESMA